MEFIGDLERAFASAIYPNRVAIAIGVAVVLVALAIVARRRRWDRIVRRHPRTAAVIVVAALAVALPMAWYLGSPLILSTTVDEPPPAAVAGPTSSSTPPSPVLTAPSTAPSPVLTAVPASPSAMVARSGSFTGADDFHFGRGTAHLIATAAGRYVVRLEDFAVRNGPDLYVYLSPSTDGSVGGAVELGRLKADTGNQNYEVPAGVDPAGANSVVIWCKQFSVLFATAPLAPS